MQRQQATDSFLKKKHAIDAMVERLASLSDDFFNVDPEHCNWSNVADIARIEMLIGQACDIAFSDGEHEL